MNQFFDKEWTLTMPVSDVIASLQWECRTLGKLAVSRTEKKKDLQKSNDTLKKQVHFLSDKQQKGAQGIRDKDTRGRRQFLEEYSETL